MESETAISSHTPERTGSTASDSIGSIFQRDTLLMENFFNDRRGKTLVLPEQRLMLAILEDALQCFQEKCSAKHGKKKQLFENVQKWFFDAGNDWVFGFESICSVLGFEPDYVRKGLVRLREKELSKRRSAPLWNHKENVSSVSP
jgi:hypothetical protein